MKAETDLSALPHQIGKKFGMDYEKQFAVMRAVFHHLFDKTVQRVSSIMIFENDIDGKINKKRNHPYVVLFGSDYDPHECTLVIVQQDVLTLGKLPRFAAFCP